MSASAQQGLRATLIGVGVNLLLVLVKGVAGIAGNSSALIADAIESLCDSMTSIVVYAGLRYAMRPPDENHPYGHGKAEPLAATIVSLGLMGAALAIAVTSIGQLVTPHAPPEPYTLVVLGLVILAKETLFRHVNKVAAEIESTAVESDAWHHRSDAITSAVAFIGISMALIGGPSWRIADEIAALVTVPVIFHNAFGFLRKALAELTDAAPASDIDVQVRKIALATPDVAGLHLCRVRKMGLEYFVDLHVLVDGDLSVRDGHKIAHAVKDAIRDRIPKIHDVLVHIEPSELMPFGRE
ncbi:cation transporter [Bryobacterales bacterium F-183]|nr:cation transporter [Bryobacterales bacterium F-183]